MKQPIHYAKIKHRTCSTKTGRRRSPVIGPAYESGMALLDETTNNTHFRPHTDGTEIIYTEIFSADPNCPYGDKSIPLIERRTSLWNDLYRENKNNDEQISAYGEIAIPNDITNAEMIEIAQKLGNHFSKSYKRPIDLSIHKKAGNNHIHFGIPEREYKNGIWLQKRHKVYKDWNGNLLFNKKYYDENGWDIRKPIIDYEKVEAENKKRRKAGNPENVNPYERDPKTGRYYYQLLKEGNRKQWDNNPNIGRFLHKAEVSKLHNEIDNIVNEVLKDHGYNVTVKRNRPEVKKILEELHIQQVRIPTSDFKTHSPIFEEIRQRNEYNRKLQNALERNLEKTETNIIDIDIAKRKEKNLLQQTTIAEREKLNAERELAIAEKQYQLAMDEYEKIKEEISIPTPPTPPVLPTFSFTGTNRERKIQFVKFYNHMSLGSSPENEIFLKAINNERDKHKKVVVDAVADKLTPDELNEIYNNATEKDKLAENFAKSYLNRLQKKLKEFAYHHGEHEKFDIYFDWSERAKNTYKKIYNQQTKDRQKSSKIDRTDDLILNG